MARKTGRDQAAPAPEVETEAIKPSVETEVADDGLTPVRTTFNPHEVIRVGDAELLDLERQGLIYTGGEYDEPDADEGATVASGLVTESGDPIVDTESGPAADEKEEVL